MSTETNISHRYFQISAVHSTECCRLPSKPELKWLIGLDWFTMKLAVFTTGAGPRAGVADPDQGVIRDVTGLLGGTDLAAVLGTWDHPLRDMTRWPAARRPAGLVRLHAPLRPSVRVRRRRTTAINP
jgi:hypothetical protein